MASDLMGKLKETLAPTSTESRNTSSYNESLNTDSYNNESRNTNSYSTEPHNTSSYNTESYTPDQHKEQRDFASNARTAPLESTSNQHRQTEGVRTGDRIDSLVENVPGVPSTQTKPS
jgi:hypothetical protein